MRVLILLALVAAAAAVPRSPQRIVGGAAVDIERYPFVANMQYGWFGIVWTQTCGGSLITAGTVLTAAYCYYGDEASSWRVLLGTSQSNSGGTQYDVAQLILHPQYNDETRENDVAIARLSTAAALSGSVGVARVAGPNYVLPDFTPLVTVGYGRLSDNGPTSTELHAVEIQLINQQLCAERYAALKTLPAYSNWPDVTDAMICAGVQGVGGRDACHGDTGGPLAHDGDILVGIVSWRYSCAHPDYPGVNTRVGTYLDWILENGSW